MKSISKYLLPALLACCALWPLQAPAQEVIEIEPLFEYPTAPDNCETLIDKCDYLVEHFWDRMDFKSKNVVDQTALNDAFKVYTFPLRWADRIKSHAAIDKMISALSKNPVLLLQFTKAAEENIYGPRAEIWIDEIYVKFLKEIVKNKKISESRRAKYQKQLNVIENCKEDGPAMQFSFTNTKGAAERYFPMSTPTVIIFGDPWDADWRIKRMKLESNIALSQAVDKGKVNILYILPDPKEGWQKELANYPEKWITGCGEGLKEKIDIRQIPSVYLVGSDGKITLKNAPVETAINEVLESIKP